MKTYNFMEAERCNMCLSQSADARVLGMRLNQSQGVNPRSKTGIGVTICECRNCGLNFPQPLPIPGSIEDHYDLPAEDYWTEEYFQIDGDYFSTQINDAKRLLDGRDSMSALDIGAGIGKAMIAMTGAGFDSWGLEPSEPFREKAIQSMGIAPERIQLSSVEAADFRSSQFDFVTFGAVLEHLYDPALAIEKALGWLKPGGVMQIEVPSSNHLMPFFLNTFYRLRGTNYVTNLSPMHSPFHLYAFTEQSFEFHGDRAGYEIVHSYVDVASIRHVPGFVKPLLRWWMSMRSPGQQLTVWLRKR